MTEGLFVTFEGGEGAGKTTLIKGLEQNLIELGYDVIVTREPGGSSLGSILRKQLLDPKSIPIYPMAELMLFLADRAQHLAEIIIPSLKAGKIILCDRYNDSTIAYQGTGRGLGFEKVKQMCQLAAELEPHLTFYLDIDPSIGLQRVRQHRAEDRMEHEAAEFHERVRQGFLILAKQNLNRIVVLNAQQPSEVVLKEAFKHLEAHVPV